MIPPLHSKTLHFQETKAFKTFFKNRPKHLQKLKIHCKILNSPNHIQRNQTLQNLINISRESKNMIKSLEYVNLCKNLGAKPGQLLLFIKKFYQVRCLGLFYDLHDMQIQRETSKWLKYTRNLCCILFKNAVPQQKNRRYIKETNLQRLENMRRTKIIKVIYSDSCEQFKNTADFPLYFDQYPSSLQEISAQLENPLIFTDKQISMQRFSCLRRLELLFSLDLKTAWMILNTLPNPQLLTCIGFFLKVSYGEFDREMIPITNFIMNCLNLEKLSLYINYNNPRLKALRLPPQNKLKTLNFAISATCDRHVREIGAFLLTANELENLNLNVDVHGHIANFSELSDSIGKLAHLKKIYLQLNTEKLSQDLIKSITCLDKLEEISVYVPDLLSKLDFFEVLERLAHQIKKLELEFSGKEEQKIEFLGVLGKMKNLKDLRIDKFSLEDKENLLKFKQILLEEMESLEKIYD